MLADAHATEFIESPKAKSAANADANLVKPSEQMNAVKTDDSCWDEVEHLKRRLAAAERELEQREHFGVIRSEMERRIKKVAKDIQLKYAKANTLELVIVMDCTGSMRSWIRQAKTAMISIIKNVKSDHPGATVWVGFVAYRDFCGGDKRLQIQKLTTNVVGVQKFISSLGAIGGGYGPEDIPGGLEAALAMPFEADAKRIVLVADAPCHGRKFYDMDDDSTYQAQIDQSPDIYSQMRELAERGIDLTFIEIRPSITSKMTKILQQEFNSAKLKSYDGYSRKLKK